MLCAGPVARPAAWRWAPRERLCVTRATATAPASTAVAAVPAKPRVVVLGSGWGAVSYVRAVSGVRSWPSPTPHLAASSQPTPRGAQNAADVTLVSPRNYFLYTCVPGRCARAAPPARAQCRVPRFSLGDTLFALPSVAGA